MESVKQDNVLRSDGGQSYVNDARPEVEVISCVNNCTDLLNLSLVTIIVFVVSVI